ncbi:MAG: FUSC family protein, partial [Solirubrobacterales bacterium]
MMLTLILVLLATAIGLAVSSSILLHLVVAGLVAGFLGYIGVAGPRAALAGVLSLVAFTVFAGTPEPISAIPPALLGILVGGGLQILVMVLPLFARRIGGLRTDISVAMRAVAFALKGHDGGPASTNALGKLTLARRQIGTSGVQTSTLEWFETMVDRTDAIRIAFLALEGRKALGDPDDKAVVEELERATAELLLALGLALELPVAKRRIPTHLAHLRSALDRARQVLPDSAGRPLAEVDRTAEALSSEVLGEWPVGRRAELQFRPRIDFEWARKMIQVRDPHHLFTRHAIRLAGLIVIATAIAELEPTTHAYWLPLTVAWITKPDLAGTAERVVSRVGGTLLGLALFGALALAVGPDLPVMIGVYVVGIVLAAAWFQANYTVCVASWTPALLALVSLVFPEVTELIAPRLVETIFGGALVIAVATIWPTRLTYELGNKLASTAKALRDYGTKVAKGHSGDLKREQQTMAEERMESGMLVAAAAHEPVSPGLKIQYEQAQEVLDSLVEAAVVAIAVEKSGEGVGDVPPAGEEITERSLERLDELVLRLEAVQEGEEPSSSEDGPGPDGQTEFERLVEDAHRAVGTERAGSPTIG